MSDTEQLSAATARRRRVLGVVLVAVTAVVLGAMLSRAPGGQAADALLRASTGWMLAAAAASTVPVVAMTGAVQAMTARALPPVRTTLVQVATSFTNALAPAGAGGAALNARYLHRAGLPLAEAVGVVAVVQLTAVLTTVLFLLLVLLGTGDLTAALSRVPVTAVGGLLVLAAALGALTTWWSPLRDQFDRRVAAPVLRAWPRLREALANPWRMAGLVASHVMVTAGLAVTLWCCLQAFAVPLSVTAMLLALLAGSTVGSAAPVPGGIGTVEAATAAALLAAGVPAADAVAVSLLYRLVTFWVRLPIGWLCLLWLRRLGAV